MWACSTTLAYCITVCVCTLSGNGYKWDTKLVLPSGFSSYQGQSCETVWSVCQASFSMIHNVASMQCLSSCSPFFFPWAHLCSSCTFILFIQCPSLSLHIIRCLWWTRRSCWMWWLWLQVFSSLSSSQWTLHCIMFLTKFLYHWMAMQLQEWIVLKTSRAAVFKEALTSRISEKSRHPILLLHFHTPSQSLL